MVSYAGVLIPCNKLIYRLRCRMLPTLFGISGDRDFRVNLALRKLRMIEHFILIVNIDTRGLSRRYNIIQMHIILKYSCEVFNGMIRNDISK